jgi:hypothetical protein
MNQITHKNFGFFQTEFIDVDFITFNLTKLSDLQIDILATYFQSLGFNCYLKKTETRKSRQAVFSGNHFKNKFELNFILTVPYQKDMIQIQFPGLSANQFYKLIKQKSIQWEKLTEFDVVLSRFDLVYERKNKNNDKISNQEFLNSSYLEFQTLHPYKNIVSERNQKGLLLKIGNRKGRRHYRIYTANYNNSLRFEAEMKGDLIKDFHDLLIASTFDQQDFETRLSYEFFKYSFQLFSLSINTSHIDWLMDRIRPFQFKNTFFLDDTMIHTHYLNQFDFNQLKKKKHLITLLQLLIYVRGLNYNTKQLNSTYRQFLFPLRHFLNYTSKTSNQYQLNKLKDFFELVRENFIIESFSDRHYRMLVTIPEVFITKSQQNIWNIEIWIAEELFDYLHPFLFPNLFKIKLTSHQFQVLFEVIKVYSSHDIRKEFYIKRFLDNYPSVLSTKQKKQIKEYFIYYLQILNQQQKLQDKVLDLSSNKILNIHDLNISHLTIAIFENINIKFS